MTTRKSTPPVALDTCAFSASSRSSSSSRKIVWLNLGSSMAVVACACDTTPTCSNVMTPTRRCALISCGARALNASTQVRDRLNPFRVIPPSTVLYVCFSGRRLTIRALNRRWPTAATATRVSPASAAAEWGASALNMPSIFLFLTFFVGVGFVVSLMCQGVGKEQFDHQHERGRGFGALTLPSSGRAGLGTNSTYFKGLYCFPGRILIPILKSYERLGHVEIRTTNHPSILGTMDPRTTRSFRGGYGNVRNEAMGTCGTSDRIESTRGRSRRCILLRSHLTCQD